MAKSKGQKPMKTEGYKPQLMMESYGRKYEIDKGPPQGHMKGNPDGESKAIGKIFSAAGHPDPLKSYEKTEAPAKSPTKTHKPDLGYWGLEKR